MATVLKKCAGTCGKPLTIRRWDIRSCVLICMDWRCNLYRRPIPTRKWLDDNGVVLPMRPLSSDIDVLLPASKMTAAKVNCSASKRYRRKAPAVAATDALGFIIMRKKRKPKEVKKNGSV